MNQSLFTDEFLRSHASGSYWAIGLATYYGEHVYNTLRNQIDSGLYYEYDTYPPSFAGDELKGNVYASSTLHHKNKS